ncbi:hypothetical protein ABIB94_005948 [Bradyrhizobium sp. JR7.2]|uniref:hypothetical protein n=1 Tax=unclassified Bradyrhizobium TaxID=2631580 RepID=UPI00339505D0
MIWVKQRLSGVALHEAPIAVDDGYATPIRRVFDVLKAASLIALVQDAADPAVAIA